MSALADGLVTERGDRVYKGIPDADDDDGRKDPGDRANRELIVAVGLN